MEIVFGDPIWNAIANEIEQFPIAFQFSSKLSEYTYNILFQKIMLTMPSSLEIFEFSIENDSEKSWEALNIVWYILNGLIGKFELLFFFDKFVVKGIL